MRKSIHSGSEIVKAGEWNTNFNYMRPHEFHCDMTSMEYSNRSKVNKTIGNNVYLR